MKIIAKNRIRVVLAEQNIRANKLAEAIGVTKTTVSNWMANNHQPRLQHMFEIAAYLGVTVSSLIDERDLKSDELK